MMVMRQVTETVDSCLVGHFMLKPSSYDDASCEGVPGALWSSAALCFLAHISTRQTHYTQTKMQLLDELLVTEMHSFLWGKFSLAKQKK